MVSFQKTDLNFFLVFLFVNVTQNDFILVIYNIIYLRSNNISIDYNDKLTVGTKKFSHEQFYQDVSRFFNTCINVLTKMAEKHKVTNFWLSSRELISLKATRTINKKHSHA